MNINWHDNEPTFEEVYPKSEFSELVRVVLMLARAVRHLWGRLSRSMPVAGTPRHP